jgi:hypothetical protein
MFRRALPYAIVAVLACAPAALASSGGAGLGAPAPQESSSDGTVSATGSGMTLTTQVAALLRGRLVVRGHADAPAGTTVRIDRLGRETGYAWSPTTSATVTSNGHFSAVWNVNHIGRFELRATTGRVRAARDANVATPTVTITVYRPSLATVYGPGLYGHRTACGQTLRPTTIGVASRTLRCGTSVALLYHGRALVVPVIDRGPFANGADWDLTAATARSLGIPGTVQLGAVSLPR